jgi:SAM-dependent methyltransferase
MGAAAKALMNPRVTRWVAVEPDARLAETFTSHIDAPPGGVTPELLIGTIESIPHGTVFDSILYFDVLEHIENDHDELRRAAGRLRPGGHLIVLAPAFQWLFSPFDEAVGHHRRYTAATLARAMPSSVEKRLLVYADSAGLLLSVANRVLLRQAAPSARQILFWDRIVIPISRLTDLAFRHVGGRSVIGVYSRRA